jgi:DNA-binding Lrp family transcriptional regulator
MKSALKEWILVQEMTSTEKLMMMLLVKNAKSCMHSKISVKEMQHELGIGERQVMKILKKLRESNLIESFTVLIRKKYRGSIYRVKTENFVKTPTNHLNYNSGSKCKCLKKRVEIQKKVSNPSSTTCTLVQVDSFKRKDRKEKVIQKEKKEKKTKEKIFIDKDVKEKTWIDVLMEIPNVKSNPPKKEWIAIQESIYPIKDLLNMANLFYTSVEIEKKYSYQRPLAAFINWIKREVSLNGRTSQNYRLKDSNEDKFSDPRLLELAKRSQRVRRKNN